MNKNLVVGLLMLPAVFGFSGCSGDDDDDASTSPTPETGCYVDEDRDGYTSEACGYGTESPDCDDTDPNVNPGATEICGNGIDDDCGGMIDEGSHPEDDDCDGYYESQDDCDDNNAAVHPGAR